MMTFVYNFRKLNYLKVDNLKVQQEHHQLKNARHQAPFKLWKYQSDFLQYGFICIAKNNVENPQCVICSEVLAHECKTS